MRLSWQTLSAACVLEPWFMQLILGTKGAGRKVLQSVPAHYTGFWCKRQRDGQELCFRTVTNLIDICTDYLPKK